MKTKTTSSKSRTFIGMLCIAAAGLSLQAQNVYWGGTGGNGGDGNWTDAGWYTTYDGGTTGTYSTSTSQPGSSNNVIAGQTTNASTLTVNTDVGTINSLYLTHNNNVPRTVSNLIVDNGGTLDITTTLRTHNSNAGAASSITVNNGGSLTVGGLATLGMRFGNGFNFVQNGGTTEFNGGVVLNDLDTTASVYQMNGGSMSATTLTFGRWNSSNFNANRSRFEISGGTVAISGAVTDSFNTPGHYPGTYQVIGSNATSISLGSMTLNAEDNEAEGGPSIISFLLDDGGVTLTDITGAASFTDTVLQIGQMDGATLAPGTYNLLRATSGISISGVTLQDNLSGGLSVSDWGVVSNSPDTLYVTVIPEPSTLALVLMSMLGVVIGMRRRK